MVSPWYLGLFIDDYNTTDNITPELSSIFSEINLLGFVTDNGQASINSKDTYQRAYIAGITTKKLADYLCLKLNHEEGIVAFYTFDKIIHDTTNQDVHGFHLTYDGEKPFSQVFSTCESLSSLEDWNPSLTQ